MSDERCDLLCLDLPKAEALRTASLDEPAAQRAAAVAKALGDPTRHTIAKALRDGEELCVCDLSWILGRAQGLVSHHLRALRQCGLASSRRDGKMVLYRLTDEGDALLRALLATPEVVPA
jgi:DNA-binding transcriptional ArsR family regulator